MRLFRLFARKKSLLNVGKGYVKAQIKLKLKDFLLQIWTPILYYFFEFVIFLNSFIRKFLCGKFFTLKTQIPFLFFFFFGEKSIRQVSIVTNILISYDDVRIEMVLCCCNVVNRASNTHFFCNYLVLLNKCLQLPHTRSLSEAHHLASYAHKSSRPKFNSNHFTFCMENYFCR